MHKKLDILSLSMSLAGGGAEKVGITVSSELKKDNNLSVYIINDRVDYDISKHGFDLEKASYKNRFLMLLELIQFITRSHFDVIISFTRMTNIYLGLIKPFINRDIKLIGFKQNLLNEVYTFSYFKKYFFLKLYQVSVKSLDLMIANSVDTKNNIFKENIIAKRTIVLPNPALENDYHLKEIIPASHRFLTEKYFTFIMVGRLVPQKGYFTALKLFEKSLKSNPDYRLLILGVGPQLNALEEYSKELGIYSKVDFLGFKQNVFEYMKAAKALLLTSEWEGFGNVIIESISLGTPVLAINCIGGPKEILISNLIGRLAKDEAHFISLLNDRNNFVRSSLEKEKMIKAMLKYTPKNLIGKYELP